MLLNSRDQSHLADMRKYASQVASFVRGATMDDFGPDSLRFAVERGIEIVGEAAGRVSMSVREEHPEILWSQIISMRNVLAHGYATVDGIVLWQVATRDINDLVDALDRILRDPGSADE